MISNSTAAWKETTQETAENLSYQQKTAGETKATAATLGMFVVKVFFFVMEKRGKQYLIVCMISKYRFASIWLACQVTL